MDSPDNSMNEGTPVRKRVGKACDRCRLKKSKCNGANPCSRCQQDNAICKFGERKKVHDKVYPKGYVEMLESQQRQLQAGLQDLYKRAIKGEGWLGEPLKESGHGGPLIHDILERLGALKDDYEDDEVEGYQEDLQALQLKLFEQGAGPMHRQDSTSGEEDHMQTEYYSPTTTNIIQFDPLADILTAPPSPAGDQLALGSMPAFGGKPTSFPQSGMSSFSSPPPSRQSWPPANMSFFEQSSFLSSAPFGQPSLATSGAPSAFDTNVFMEDDMDLFLKC
jgi:hypothetical protein